MKRKKAALSDDVNSGQMLPLTADTDPGFTVMVAEQGWRGASRRPVIGETPGAPTEPSRP